MGEDCNLRPAQAKKLARPYLKNKLGMVVHDCSNS
jgi:hypothetical protein